MHKQGAQGIAEGLLVKLLLLGRFYIQGYKLVQRRSPFGDIGSS